MQRLTSSLCSVLVIIGAVSCRWYPDCPSASRPGLQITVVDSATGARATPGSTLAVEDGSYSEMITVPADDPRETIAAASGRAGTYSVTIQNQNYLPWSKRDVVVTSDGCLPNTVSLTAKLVHR